MDAELQIAQVIVDVVAFFMPAFMVMIALEWAIGFIRRD